MGKRVRIPIKCKVCGESKPREESGENMCNACWEAKTRKRYHVCPECLVIFLTVFDSPFPHHHARLRTDRRCEGSGIPARNHV